jgi:hypothetical protein
MDSVINIPGGVKYLNEHLKDLPENCIFDKSIVGCGGTTVALKCDHNYVVCVPFVSLIQNKVSQHKNVFGLYKGVSTKLLKQYLEDSTIIHKKIMVTYDSLPKLLSYINGKDYKLLIDEYHLLFNSYSFRTSAVKGVLDNYTEFKSFTFMTATLLEREFILQELHHLPIVTAKWENVKEITVHSVKCEADVIHTVCFLINEYLDGSKTGNCYLFVNSVEFIKDVVTFCKLTDSNARAIWSINNKTQTGLKRGLTTDTPKKINLFTSTCFEGADFYDKEAHIYIVSDGKKAHTLVDISTSFQQIAHRVRDTKYWEIITHIYQSTRYEVNVTYAEYQRITEIETKKAKSIVADYPNVSVEIQNVLKSHYSKETNCDTYLKVLGDTLLFDENMIKIDLYNFKVTKSMYKLRVNLSQEYKKNGLGLLEQTSELNHVVKINPKPNFKETILEVQKGDSDVYLAACKKYTFLKEAIEKLGFSGIESCGYQTTNIKRKLVQMSNISEKSKILNMLKTSSYVYEGSFIPTKSAKSLIQDIYNTVGLKTTAKATDIGNFYHIKATTKSVNNKIVAGFVIIKEKI